MENTTRLGEMLLTQMAGAVGQPDNASEMEQELRQALMWLGRVVMGLWLARLAGRYPAKTVKCECGHEAEYVPTLKLRYGVLTTALIVGVLWGAWHLLTNLFWATDTYSGALSLALFLTVRGFGFLVGQLLAFRVLMVWVYDRTGSLLVAMLMHASLTASTFILQPPAISGDSLLAYDLVLAAAMWVVVAAVAVANRGKLSRQPLPRRGA